MTDARHKQYVCHALGIHVRILIPMLKSSNAFSLQFKSGPFHFADDIRLSLNNPLLLLMALENSVQQ
jgi:hypothetical protein